MTSNLMQPTDELKQQYIERRSSELTVYMQSLKSQDFETIAFLGHRMRGNGISFGFPEISILGEKMETAAKNKEVSTLRNLSVEFMNWIDQQKSAGQ